MGKAAAHSAFKRFRRKAKEMKFAKMLPCVFANQVVPIFADDEQMADKSKESLKEFRAWMGRNASGNKQSRSLDGLPKQFSDRQPKLFRHSFPNSTARCTNTMSKNCATMTRNGSGLQTPVKEWKTFADGSCKASRTAMNHI